MRPRKGRGGESRLASERFRPQCRSGNVTPMGSPGQEFAGRCHRSPTSGSRALVTLLAVSPVGWARKSVASVQRLRWPQKAPQLGPVSSLLSSQPKARFFLERAAAGPATAASASLAALWALGGAFTRPNAVSDPEQPDCTNIVVPISQTGKLRC